MSKHKLDKRKSFNSLYPPTKQNPAQPQKTQEQKLIDVTSAAIVMQRALEIACSCENCDDWCVCERLDTERCITDKCLELIRKAKKELGKSPETIKNYLR